MCLARYFGYTFFFSSRRRHTRFDCDWSSDVCSSDLSPLPRRQLKARERFHVHVHGEQVDAGVGAVAGDVIEEVARSGPLAQEPPEAVGEHRQHGVDLVPADAALELPKSETGRHDAGIVAQCDALCHPAPVPSAPPRPIVAWALYDFANSAFAAIIQATIFPAFYANLVVGNADGRGDFWWGLAVSVSMVLVAAPPPGGGGTADPAGVRKPFFVWLTLASVVATALLATVGPGMIARGFALAVAGIVTYEAAFVYYNSYLPRITDPATLGSVSAAGFAVGYAGSLVRSEERR